MFSTEMWGDLDQRMYMETQGTKYIEIKHYRYRRGLEITCVMLLPLLYAMIKIYIHKLRGSLHAQGKFSFHQWRDCSCLDLLVLDL